MKYTRFVSLLAVSALLAASLAGCGSSASSVASSASSEAVSSVAESAVSEAASESAAASSARALEDGTYTAEFDTDSSMFHVNEASDGKGTLTVEDGQMTLHISLQSKKIVNLYVGMAADAPDHEADWLQPTTDTVTEPPRKSTALTSRWKHWTPISSWPSWAPRASGMTTPSASAMSRHRPRRLWRLPRTAATPAR